MTNEEDRPCPAPPPEPPAYSSGVAPTAVPAVPSPTESEEPSSGTGWTAFGILAGIVVLIVIVAVASARHWTKVDVAEQSETFRIETYQTGNFDISNDRVSPCYIGQDWTACINVQVGIYNSACVGVNLTTMGYNLCGEYLAGIDRMKAQGGWGYTVSSLGGWGHLSRSPETAARRVSNNDHRPAVTHEAVCYLGFLGECR